MEGTAIKGVNFYNQSLEPHSTLNVQPRSLPSFLAPSPLQGTIVSPEQTNLK